MAARLNEIFIYLFVKRWFSRSEMLISKFRYKYALRQIPQSLPLLILISLVLLWLTIVMSTIFAVFYKMNKPYSYDY